MKKILGLDLGTNSIGWALIKNDLKNNTGDIISLGSRIIPMEQPVLTDFEKGNTISQTAKRTGYRGTRRLYQRDNLRRERLHRVLNVLDFLPKHYADEIDFEIRLGQFKKGKEPKLNYKRNANGRYEFIFMDSFLEMTQEFENNNKDVKISYDWTLYFLRKKALTQRISKEELAWILLNFNQKRGYYQLRGEEEEEQEGKTKTFEVLYVSELKDSGDKIKGTGDILYDVYFSNGWKYDKPIVKTENWVNKTKEFIVTTSTTKDGSIKRTYKAVDSEQDWVAIKAKTQQDIDKSNKTVGQYIFDALLNDPSQKINGKLIKTIERKYYRRELEQIIQSQTKFHDELQNRNLYESCVTELYPRNEAHRNNIKNKNFEYLFLNDIIFYQRPLKSKKSTVSSCQFESRVYKKVVKDKETGKEKEIWITEPLKVIPKSHPLFQEFRLLQWFKLLKFYKKEDEKGNLVDEDITSQLLHNLEDKIALFEFLKSKKNVDQKQVIQYFVSNKQIDKKDKDNYRWNYVEDKKYPCFETKASFLSRMKKVDASRKIDSDFVFNLWHIIYSVKDKNEFKQALKTFAEKNNIEEESFVSVFEKYPPYDSQYGAFSEKAIKKLIPLMRFDVALDKSSIDLETRDRIDKIITGEYDDTIQDRVRELIEKQGRDFKSISDFNNLPFHLASYVVYNRHSEIGDIQKWNTPSDIDNYLQKFKQHSLRNPIVEQVVTETLRTVRDIWSYYGKGEKGFFDRIHVELGREMKNPADKRKKISERNTENENTNARIKAVLQELTNDGARHFSPSHQEILKIYEEGVFQNPDARFDKVKEDDIKKIRRNSSPTKSEINKYKLWLEQGYVSPYTGEIIPLNKLFTKDYQIEHIIPQSRYFDDSLSNKIICESDVNQLKNNQTAYEFIKNHGTQKVSVGHGKNVEIFSINRFETHCNKYFKKNKTKLKKLLSEGIPEGFIERQLNDSRYISKLIKGLLSNIVREDNEQEATSKNIVPVTGAITSKLKQDWGLNDKWNEIVAPRFKRLNELTNSNDFGFWDEKINAFRTQVPDEISRGFNKKRIDHRHHAMDALVISCCTKEHINYLNSINSEKNNYSLRDSLLVKNKEGDYKKQFLLPWSSFPIDAKEKLENTIVSFKQNTRVINKTNNKTWQWVDDKGKLKKKLVPQTKGNNWAIRKSLHKETVSGLVELKRKRKGLVAFSKGIENVNLLVDKNIKNKVKSALALFDNDISKVKKHFKKTPIVIDNVEVKKVEQYEFIKKATATRTLLTDKFTRKQLNQITDTGIQKILENHIANYIEDGEERFDLAFGIEGIEELNENIKSLNNGKEHQPIRKVRIYEVGNKFSVSENKKDAKHTKYVEAAKGTNLFFAIYWNEEKQKREYETIPLNLVIEHQKQRAALSKEERENVPMIPVKKTKGQFLFSLSPNDLVYVPTDEEIENIQNIDFSDLTKEQIGRVYKLVSSTQSECHFIPNRNSTEIKKNENGTNSKNERIQDFYDGNCFYDLKGKHVMIK
jgi:CRISPR-associated endonuclease Csn1